MKHFLDLDAISKDDMEMLLQQADTLKGMQRSGKTHPLLSGKSLGMIFQKPSNRTRVSFEVGINQLGGQSVYIREEDIQMKKRESIEDIARTLSRYLDIIMIRANSHEDIVAFADAATVPIINGLSDQSHPCQAIADLLTIKEKKGQLNGQKVVFVGDGNNVALSLKKACDRMGMNFILACPKGYEFKDEPVTVVHDPVEAVKDADVIYTDVWVSMGQEAEVAKRQADFSKYALTTELVAGAKTDVIVMHCLPANRGEEITHDVLEGPHSVVFDQAENRLHAQKAIMVMLLDETMTKGGN